MRHKTSSSFFLIFLWVFLQISPFFICKYKVFCCFFFFFTSFSSDSYLIARTSKAASILLRFGVIFHIFIYLYIYIYIYIWVFNRHIHTYTHICVHIYQYIYTYEIQRMCIHVHVYMYKTSLCSQNPCETSCPSCVWQPFPCAPYARFFFSVGFFSVQHSIIWCQCVRQSGRQLVICQAVWPSGRDYHYRTVSNSQAIRQSGRPLGVRQAESSSFNLTWSPEIWMSISRETLKIFCFNRQYKSSTTHGQSSEEKEKEKEKESVRLRCLSSSNKPTRAST